MSAFYLHFVPCANNGPIVSVTEEFLVVGAYQQGYPATLFPPRPARAGQNPADAVLGGVGLALGVEGIPYAHPAAPFDQVPVYFPTPPEGDGLHYVVVATRSTTPPHVTITLNSY